MPPALSMQRSACVVMLKRSQHPSVTLQSRFRWTLGLKVRRVFRCEKDTLFPDLTSLPA